MKQMHELNNKDRFSYLFKMFLYFSNNFILFFKLFASQEFHGINVKKKSNISEYMSNNSLALYFMCTLHTQRTPFKRVRLVSLDLPCKSSIIAASGFNEISGSMLRICASSL